MTGVQPRPVSGGWRVRSETATVALVCAVIVGLTAGVLAGLHARGGVAVQVVAARAVPGGGEQVPLGAVVIDPRDGRTVVFVVAGGHALRQPVSVTAPSAGTPMVTVLSGLSPGAVVVVAPPPTLRDGSGVTTAPYRGAAR